VNVYRVYADTSVFGGVFDDEFATASRTFFNQVGERFVLVTSALVEAELATAPSEVCELYQLELQAHRPL
jgi:hypothetical protein